MAGHDLSKDDFRMIKAGNDFIDSDGHVYRHADITSPPAAARAYAYCTDTAYYEPLVPLIRGVDLLYHEATFMDDKEKDAQAKFHSTARQAAMIAKKAEVKKLMLGHYSARYKNLDGLLPVNYCILIALLSIQLQGGYKYQDNKSTLGQGLNFHLFSF